MGRKSLSALVVAAHPDDEVAGAGIWLSRHRATRAHILHITDGSPRDLENARALGFGTRKAYARARRRELAEALQLIGISPASCSRFSFPDKEAYLNLPDLIDRLDSVVGRLRPSLVLSPAYEGGHPDHDAAAFAVARVREKRKSFEHWEFPLYHADEDGRLVTGRFVRGRAEEVITLSRRERALKARMLACFRTQSNILSNFKLDYERLRRAPVYNFTKTPHPGRLLYERWGWGISGANWRRAVKKSLSV